MGKENGVSFPEREEAVVAEPEYSIPFSSNPDLLLLANALQTTPVNYRRVAERLQGYLPPEPPLLSIFMGTMFETHVELTIEDFARRNGTVDISPIPPDTKSPGYTFKPELKIKPTLLALPIKIPGEEDTRTRIEFDHIIVVNGLPVVVEDKCTNIKNKNIFRSEVERVIRPTKLNRRTEPLVDYFGPPLGCMLVTVSEALRHSDTETNYTDNGGILVTIPDSHGSFMHFVKGTQKRLYGYVAFDNMRSKL